MIDFVERILLCQDRFAFLSVFSKTLTSSFVVAKDSVGFKTFSRFIKHVDGATAGLTLVDDHLSFYRLLTSNATMSKDEGELARGAFLDILSASSRSLEIPVCAGEFPLSSTYQKVLLLLLVPIF